MALLGAIPFPKYYEQTTLEADGASDAEEAWFQSQPRFIHNESERFESRFVTLKIMEDNPSIFLKGSLSLSHPHTPSSSSNYYKNAIYLPVCRAVVCVSCVVCRAGMEGSSLGCWSSHGEGKVHFPSKAIEAQVLQQHLAPIRYVDDHNRPTETYVGPRRRLSSSQKLTVSLVVSCRRYPFNPNGSMQGIAALCSPDGRHMAIMPHPERTFLRWQWAWMPHEWKEETVPVSPWLHLFQNARRWCDDTTTPTQQ
jgi:phosphoribosylformylglycinamidine synthase